jgi:hypothetical protein
MGGTSDGFALEGFDVTGIDIEDMPSKGYKHKFIRADIRDLKGEDFRGYNVIWGSPPCRDYTRIGEMYGHNWKNPPNPEKGLDLVYAFKWFIESAKPTFWVLENVYGLSKYLSSPQFTTYLTLGNNGQGKKHSFWGNFPQALIPKDCTKKISFHIDAPNGDKWMRPKKSGKNASWENAKIPLSCSRAFAVACREALTLKKEASL